MNQLQKVKFFNKKEERLTVDTEKDTRKINEMKITTKSETKRTKNHEEVIFNSANVFPCRYN